MKKVLAIVSSEKELQEIQKQFEEKDGEKYTVSFLICDVFSFSGKKKPKMALPDSFLSETELNDIERKAAFFARNWYKFNKNFEKETTYKGISLGFVYENTAFSYFKRILMLLKALPKAIESEKPDIVVAGKNTMAGNCIKEFGKTTRCKKIKLLELSGDRKFVRFPNFTRKKMGQVKQKLAKILTGSILHDRQDSGKKTVFIRSGEGYLGKLEQELRKDGSFNVVSLDEFLLKELANPTNVMKYVSTRKKMKPRFRKLFKQYFESNAMKKMSFKKINFGEMLKTWFVDATDRDWPEFVFLIDRLSKLFAEKKPAVSVMWVGNVPFERICILLAKKFGGKSIELQHGIFWNESENGDWIRSFAPLTADYIGVWGKIFKEILEKKGVPAERIKIIGAPRFDDIFNNSFNSKKTRERIGINTEEKLVVFAPELSADMNEISEAVKVVEGIPNTKLVLKLHPTADLKKFEQFASQNTVLLQHENIHELLNASDVVLIKNSTVGLEAMLFGKSIIVFIKNLQSKNIFASTNAALKAKNKNELENALEKALNEKKEKNKLRKEMSKFVRETAFKQDGKAAQRFIQLVKKSIKQTNEKQN